MRNKIAIPLLWKQNNNEKSLAYGKYFLEVQQRETLSTRGLLEHIMGHGLGYPRAVVQGVLAQLAECLTELILQGQPVKLDGFGTFKLNVINEKGVDNPSEVNSATEKMEGLKLVVIPDNSDLDKLTSKANLAAASVTIVGVKMRDTTGDHALNGTIMGIEKWKETHPVPAPEP